MFWRVRVPLGALIDTYSNLFLKMIEDPCVIGSSPILRPSGAVSSIGRAAYYIDVSSFMPKDSLSRRKHRPWAVMRFKSSEGIAIVPATGT